MKSTGDAVSGVFESLSRAPVVPEDGDYKGVDGLWYCGKCRTRKQKLIRLPPGAAFVAGGDIVVACQCKCQEEAYEKKMAEYEYQEEMRRIQRRRDASMMESKYQTASFSSYQTEPGNERAFRTARRYVDKFDTMMQENQGLIFYGPVGTGKSFTAACIANELMDRNISVIMTSFVKILQNIQGPDCDEARYIAMLNSAKLLILDDLGTERNTDFALEKVYNVIDSRVRASMPMILTTNLELKDMMDNEDIRYKRIYDRIFETCYPVRVSGESFRRKAAALRFDEMEKLIGKE